MTRPNVEGRALVASPHMTERNFMKSVVYIIKHDDEGAYGLILNRPTSVAVGELVEQVTKEPSVLEDPIYSGGPVEGPVVVLHQHAEVGGAECGPDLYMSADHKEFAQVCSQENARFRVFHGYSGWGPAQLESELKQGDWLVWEPTVDDLFSPSETLWESAIKEIGRQILADGINISRIPMDPTFN